MFGKSLLEIQVSICYKVGPEDLGMTTYFLRRLFGSGRSSGMGAFSRLSRQFSKSNGAKRKAPKSVRGTADLFGKHLLEKRAIVEKATETAQKYGYSEIQTPTIEFTEVFTRSLGTTSDIISKEMFTWKDSRGRDICLRPENTASIARALVSSGRVHNQANLPLRICYHGSMFRRERPQKGRLREFTQFGVESVGSASSHEDVDIISMACDYLSTLGLFQHSHIEQNQVFENIVLTVNTLGDDASRDAYQRLLEEYFHAHKADLSPDSKRRLDTNNVLRILDSKAPQDAILIDQAPRFSECLTYAAKERFDEVTSGLDTLHIPYVIDERLVRGLDYYTHTVFEFVKKDSKVSAGINIGAGQSGTVLAGGRYDKLLEEMGGPSTPAVGWAAGIERIHLLLGEIMEYNAQSANVEDTTCLSARQDFLSKFHEKHNIEKVGIMVIPILNKQSDEDCIPNKNIVESSLSLLGALRNELTRDKGQSSHKYVVYRARDLSDNSASVKKSMKWANENQVRYVVFLGAGEIEEGKITLKDMSNGNQLSCNAVTDIIETIKASNKDV